MCGFVHGQHLSSEIIRLIVDDATLYNRLLKLCSWELKAKVSRHVRSQEQKFHFVCSIWYENSRMIEAAWWRKRLIIHECDRKTELAQNIPCLHVIYHIIVPYHIIVASNKFLLAIQHCLCHFMIYFLYNCIKAFFMTYAIFSVLGIFWLFFMHILSLCLAVFGACV